MNSVALPCEVDLTTLRTSIYCVDIFFHVLVLLKDLF